MLLDEETSRFGSIGNALCTELPERDLGEIEDAKPSAMADE